MFCLADVQCREVNAPPGIADFILQTWELVANYFKTNITGHTFSVE
jgi:hypothetical protein